MTRCSRTISLAVLSVIWYGTSASADSLRCQSVNGNLNCSGSGGVSCQTIDGKTVCTSGHGDVVQTFGNGSHNATAGDERLDDDPPALQGQRLMQELDAIRAHRQSDWLSRGTEP